MEETKIKTIKIHFPRITWIGCVSIENILIEEYKLLNEQIYNGQTGQTNSTRQLKALLISFVFVFVRF